MRKPIPFTPERKRKAWFLYTERPEVTIPQIAQAVGFSTTTFLRRIRQDGWPPRRTAIAQAREQAAPKYGVPPPRTSPEAVAQTLEHSVIEELDRLNTALRAHGGEPEETARVFASLAKTLATARSMQADKSDDRQGGRSAHDADGEPPPRSLEELRDELARHLDRIVADEAAAGGDDFLHIARACEAP